MYELTESTEQYGSPPALQYIGMCLYCALVCMCVWYDYICFGLCRRGRLYGNTPKLVNTGNGLEKGGRDFTFLYTTVVLEYFTHM